MEDGTLFFIEDVSWKTNPNLYVDHGQEVDMGKLVKILLTLLLSSMNALVLALLVGTSHKIKYKYIRYILCLYFFYERITSTPDK